MSTGLRSVNGTKVPRGAVACEPKLKQVHKELQTSARPVPQVHINLQHGCAYCSLAYSALACFRVGMSGLCLTGAVPLGAAGRRNAGRSECSPKMDLP